VQADVNEPGYVWVFGIPSDEEEGEEDRSRFFRPDEARLGRQRVPTAQLKDNVAAFVQNMGDAIEGVPARLAGFSIESIQLSAEISATGKVSLLGNGGELTGKGGITFTLTRVQRSDTSPPTAADEPVGD
jgi:hypothetical protein